MTALLITPTLPAWGKRLIAVAVATTLGTLLAVITGQLPELPAALTSGITRGIVIIGLVTAGSQAVYPLLKGATNHIEAGWLITDKPRLSPSD